MLDVGRSVAHIGRALGSRHGTYVLDNAEHVIEPLARVLGSWTERLRRSLPRDEPRSSGRRASTCWRSVR
jgi:hypothetical protein